MSKYDIEDRCYEFAKSVRIFTFNISKNLRYHPDLEQLIRSSGSIGANYIEANEN